MTNLPTSDRPLTMDPALEEALEEMLEPYSGEDLENAQAAVEMIYESGAQGTWDDLLDTYREAVEEAVA